MKKWEYRIVVLGGDYVTDNLAGDNDIKLPKANGERTSFLAFGRYLDQLGAEGWELVSVGSGSPYVFKRPKP